MKRFLLLVTLAFPALARGEMWGWADSAGRPHYSNVPEHVPARAGQVRGDVGYLGGTVAEEALAEAAAVETEPGPSVARRLGEERRIKRRLAEIERFRAQVRARQMARLQAFANSTLLPDWMVADRWLSMQDEEKKLQATLEELKRQPQPAS
jgi:hypothetical protein